MGGLGRGSCWEVRGQGGCERRIEVFGKIQKQYLGMRGSGCQVRGGGSGFVGGGGQGGC